MNELLPLLLSNILVATALGLVATWFGWSGKHAALSRWIWIAVFLKLITPPLVSVPVEFPQSWAGQLTSVSTFLNEAIIKVPVLHGATGKNLAPRASNPYHGNQDDQQRPSPTALSLATVLGSVWVAGSVWLLARGARRYWRTVKLLNEEAECDEDATQIVRELLGRDAQHAVPQVRLIPARISPMLFGAGKSISIVCPRELWLGLDWQQRTAFLAHEAAHFERRDHWVRWLEWFVTSTYWWLPIVYWARLQLERHEEVACDRLALEMLGRHSDQPVRRSYAEALLNVVDFLSEAHAPVPRLASRMQPTASLEERLRLIMSETAQPPPAWLLILGLSIGLVSIVVHPTAQFVPYSTETRLAPISSGNRSPITDPSELITNRLRGPAEPNNYSAKIDLPPAPKGWWNLAPEAQWVDQELGNNRLQVQAKAGGGLKVARHGADGYTFDARDVRALAYVPGSDRMIVGRSNGELHLWDAVSSRSVSLIGKHAGEITSLCWSPASGLISSDSLGNVIRWDMQSGQVLSSIELGQLVSTVRCSSNGTEIAVLMGSWSEAAHELRLVQFLDGTSLERTHSTKVTHSTAVVYNDAVSGWLRMDWTGQVFSMLTGEQIGSIPKHEVSGVVLCGDCLSPESIVKSISPVDQNQP